MNLNDLVGMPATVWILNQGQVNLTPGEKFDGVLRGVDQGAYIFETDEHGPGGYIVLPIASCRVLVSKKR